jgi:hypothetical protein
MECGFITEDNFGCKKFVIFKFESQNKMCSELHCLGKLHGATVGTYNFQISNVCAELCALLCVACLIVSKYARLIYMDCKREPHELYPPELQ